MHRAATAARNRPTGQLACGRPVPGRLAGGGVALTLTLITALTCAPAFAAQPPDAGQTLQQIAPPAAAMRDENRSLPPATPAPATPAPATPAVTPAADSPHIEVRRLRIAGATLFPESELLALVADGIGKTHDLASLDALAARISAFYREQGYPLAFAWLPAQRVDAGEITIAVLEGRYGKIAFANRSGLADAAVGLAGIGSWEVIRGKPLEHRLLLLADTPGIEVKSTLTPGASVGTTDLLVDVERGPRFAGSLEADNYGSRHTGAERVGGSLQVNNPLERGDRLSLRALSSGGGLDYGRIGYQLPVGTDGAQFGAAHSEMRYRLGREFAALKAGGHAVSDSLYLLHPFVRSRSANLYGQLGIERKDLEDRVDSTDTVTAKRSELWTLALSGNRRDGLGGGANDFSLTLTGGRLAIRDAAAQGIDRTTAQTAGAFAKAKLDLARLQTLGDDLALHAALQAQWAGKNLDSSEKLSLGGSQGVRAYPQGEAAGDSGYLLNLELRYAASGPLQLHAFLDHGRALVNRRPWTAADNRRRLSGHGIGLAWNPEPTWLLKASIAWRGAAKATVDTDRPARAWVQLVHYF